ncbi:hypothetical protein FS837_003910 [Tulasnella sp. UAMH 9824]|nr:hypothetical protein FS837_003910 [Tulasnella sp. UAMH 9824]
MEELLGYTTRVVVPGGEDWSRLLEKLAVDGVSQLQNAIENLTSSSPTSNPVAVSQNDNSRLSESPTLPAEGSVGTGGPEPRLLETSPIPCVGTTPQLTTLVELRLTNGIRLQYADSGTFLRWSSNLQVLRLVNVKFVGGNAQLVKGKSSSFTI